MAKTGPEICEDRKWHDYIGTLGRCVTCGKKDPAKKPREWSKNYIDYHGGYDTSAHPDTEEEEYKGRHEEPTVDLDYYIHKELDG